MRARTDSYRSELAGLDVDGRVISPGDLGEQRAAEIRPRRRECHVVVDGDGHNPGFPSGLMLIKASASPSWLHIPARWGLAALQESFLGSCILRIKGCPNNPLRPAPP